MVGGNSRQMLGEDDGNALARWEGPPHAPDPLHSVYLP